MRTTSRHNLAEASPPAHSGAPADSRAAASLRNVAELVRRSLDCKAAVVKAFDPGKGSPNVELRASAVLGDDPWMIGNVRVDPCDLSDPLAAEDLGLRFYAGVPLHASDGRTIGVLAAVDFEPRALTDGELETLKLLAAIAVELAEAQFSARLGQD